MGKAPNRKYKLLRKDKKGNNNKENCFWGKCERLFKFNGKILNGMQLSKETGINYNTLMTEVYKGIPIEKILKDYERDNKKRIYKDI